MSTPAPTQDPYANAQSAATCVSGSAPEFLPPVYNSTGQVTCLDGFYCPLLDASNSSTFPVSCIPEPSCALDRVTGSACDVAQSAYEPRRCPKAYYCPTPQEKYKCPSGYFCGLGTKTPNKCPPLSLCGEGSFTPRQTLPLLLVVIVFIILFIIRRFYLTKWRLRGHQPGAMSGSVTPKDGGSDKGSAAARSPAEQQSDANGSGEAGGMEMQQQPQPAAENHQPDSYVDMSSKNSNAPSGNDAATGMGATRVDTAVLVEHFRQVSEGQKPIQIDFSDLHVSLPKTKEFPAGKTLLEGVSGSLKPGTVTAIMGPSGAGKTVLLTTLLQRIDPSWSVEGSLLVNKGQGEFSKLRSSIGFVPQDDTLHNELTVEANIYYASEMRLPSDWSAERRAAMREVVLEALGLLQHRSTVIGNEAERGVSGGQRKRASIGVELASGPLLLFLDEPTSGLDSTTSLELVKALKVIAVAANITVAMVVHQPRVEIWDALDELLILGVGGRTVYQGPQSAVRSYFEGHGVAFDPKMNPADTVMDTVVSDSERKFVNHWKAREVQAPNSATPLFLSPDTAAGFHGASIPKQFALFFTRSLEKQLSDATPFIVEIIVIFLCGAVLGNSMMDYTHDANYKAPYGVISPANFQLLLPQLHMYQLMSLGLAAAVSGVNVFGAERPQYFREVPTGFNRGAYFVANVTASLFRVCIATLVYCSFFTVLASLPVPFSFQYFATLLSYWSIYGLGACVSVTASRQASALIASTGSVCFAVFNGFIDFPLIMKQFTPGFWASQILQEQHARWITHWAADPMASHETGFESGELTVSFVVMVALGVGLHVIAFVLMVVTHRDKQR